MRVACQQCKDLQQIALTASKTYHQRLQDLEAAHICHNSEALMLLSIRLDAAFKSRNTAIAELSNHESTCAGKKRAEARSFIERKTA